MANTDVTMCHGYMDLDWFCQLLPCSDGEKPGSLMTNSWSFTAAATKNAQSNRIYMSVGIVDFHMFEQDSALAHRACEKVEFLDCETHDFMSPCCLVLTWWTFFIRLSYRNGIATDSTSWHKSCTSDTWRQRYVTTSKEYLINCHI